MTHERGSSYEFICQPIIKHKPDALDWIRLRGLVSNERDCSTNSSAVYQT